MSRNFTPEARERIRQAQARRWAARAPFEVKLMEEGGLIFATNGETTYLFYPGQRIPEGFEVTSTEDSYAVLDRNGKVAVQELTKDQAERICAELDAPFTGVTP